MLEYLKKIVKEIYKNEDEDFYGLPYFLGIKNLPKDGDHEEVDFENFNWLEITDDNIVVCCGGDWQEPLILSIELINGELVVVNSEEGFEDGLSEDDFNKLLFDTYEYDEIIN